MTFGRNTTPVPTLAKGPRGDLAFHNWLIENALNEARANRDTLRRTIFREQLENLNKTKKGGRVELTESELDDANVYLWEYQPKPIRVRALRTRGGLQHIGFKRVFELSIAKAIKTLLKLIQS